MTARVTIMFESDEVSAAGLSTIANQLRAGTLADVAVSYAPPWQLSGDLTVERLKQWLDYHQDALALKAEFPERVHLKRSSTVVLTANDDLRAQLFAQTSPELWDVVESLESVAELDEADEPPRFRPSLFAPQLAAVLELLNRADQYPDLVADKQQLQSQVDALSADKDHLQQQCDTLVADKVELEQRVLDLSADKDRLQQQAEALAAEKVELQQRVDALSADKDRLQQQVDALVAEKAELQRLNEQAVKSAEEESELLLLQLHQVQEELEKQFIDAEPLRKTVSDSDAQVKKVQQDLESARKQLDEKAKQLADAIKQRDQLTVQAENLKKDIDRVKSDRTALDKQKQELTASLQRQKQALKSAAEESELLLLQLHQVQEELEKQFIDAEQIKKTVSERDAQAKKHQVDLDNARKQLDGKGKQLAEAIKQRDELTASLQTQKQALKSAAEESELLLLQLHQVQEELERQFLDANALDSEVTAATALLRDVRSTLTAQLRQAG